MSSPAQQPQTSTIDKLQALLNILNIKIVYYVDDENNLSDFDIQIVNGELEKIYGLKKENELTAIALDKWDRTLPKEGVIGFLVNNWKDFPFEKKKELYSTILAISGGENIKIDFERATRVKEQIPSALIKILSPHEWDKEKVTLKEKIGDGERALILFDEDLRHAGKKYETTKGQDLIVEVKEMEMKDKVICTLLTHKAGSIGRELAFRDEIIEGRENHDLQVNDFFPLSKERLDIPEVFADGIKKALINSYFETVKHHTIEIISHSFGKAIEKIKKFDTYDFEDTILKSSLAEGIWEPETIVRVCNIVFESELKQRMVDTGYVATINKAFKSAQLFTHLSFTIPEDMQPYSDKLELRHFEIYDMGEVVNALRKPLESGDIFILGDAHYILVSQPCDMMVRGGGAKVGLRSAKTGTLLKINSKEFKKNKLKEYEDAKDMYPLPYFVRGRKDLGIVDFRDYFIVDLDYLDLCVSNGIGEGKINLNQPSVDFEFLSKPLEKRMQFIMDRLTPLGVRINELKTHLADIKSDKQDIILSEFYPKLVIATSSGSTYEGSLDADLNFDFKVKRTLNYKNPGATHLLNKYTAYLSRDADLHDFAK